MELRHKTSNISKDDIVHVCNIGLRRKLRKWSSGKLSAVKLGYLLPNKHYRLYIKLTSPLGEQNRYLGVTFTIKDRDELYMQIFILIIALGFSFVLWMFERGLDLDELFQLGLGSIPRIFGYRELRHFYLIWYDEKHGIHPTKAK